MAAVSIYTGLDESGGLGASNDDKSVWGAALRVMDSVQAEAFINWLALRARGLLCEPRHWSAVERLAGKLLNERTLSGRAARKVIKEALSEFD